MDFSRIGNLVGQLGLSYAVELTNNIETFEKFVVGELNKRLRDVEPQELYYCYRDGESLMKDFESDELRNLTSMVNLEDSRVAEIKANLSKYMYHFNSTWCLETLKREQPDFFSVIMTDENPEKFKQWFANEIQAMIKMVNDAFSSNS